jgi:hypothetical protein
VSLARCLQAAQEANARQRQIQGGPARATRGEQLLPALTECDEGHAVARMSLRAWARWEQVMMADEAAETLRVAATRLKRLAATAAKQASEERTMLARLRLAPPRVEGTEREEVGLAKRIAAARRSSVTEERLIAAVQMGRERGWAGRNQAGLDWVVFGWAERCADRDRCGRVASAAAVASAVPVASWARAGKAARVALVAMTVRVELAAEAVDKAAAVE